MSGKTKFTPMLKQFLEIKNQHPDKLILFRMGDFYETFFDDAKLASKILGITLTARNKKAESPVPLAGFPYHALDNYLEKLVKNGLKVVICEQVEDPKQAKGLVKRDIIDIITPGAIINENLIGKVENNFLCSLVFNSKKNNLGLAFIDASTGDFLVTQIKSDQLRGELTRLRPSEILMRDEETRSQLDRLKLEYEPTVTVYETWYFEVEEAEKLLKNHFAVNSLEGFGLQNKDLAVTAAGVSLSYIRSLKKDELKHLSNIRFYSLADYMQIDDVTCRNLELNRSLRNNSRSGSLIAVLDQTQTPMGARKLAQWLLHPLLSETKIYQRSNAVRIFKENYQITAELRNILKEIGDLSRLLAKLGTKRINPRDAIALKNYLEFAPEIRSLLNELNDPLIKQYSEQIMDYSPVTKIITEAIVEEPPLQINDGGIIKDNYNEMLDELRNISKNGKSWIARLEDYERKKTGISSLKVNYNRVFGYYIEVTKTHKDKIPDYYIRKQTLVNSERYISPELKEYEAKVLGAEERIKNLEYELFQEIRKKLFVHIITIQNYVETISLVDVLANFAHMAYQNNYQQPFFNKEGILNIKNSRHPVIEKILDTEEFIPNDIYLDKNETRIALITGPNMAGKSTYLRQVGLLAIMAQIGSFIPAEKISMPVFDKIFTRVGASDNLTMGQSTFLVEMLETANILNSATPDSLILLDEIGRGTSTFDGLSLAWAIVEYLHNNQKIRAKTLFATHYHELTELENVLTGVKNYNIIVKEWKEKVIFLRKIERGSADQSYGIQVARLAGIPARVIRRANQILNNLEEHEISPQGLSANARKQLAQGSYQMNIFDSVYEKMKDQEKIIEELGELDIENLTPLEALKKLSELQKKILE